MSNNFLTLHTKVEVESEDHIYYNLSAYNGTSQNIVAKFSETRTQPILENPKLWNTAVIRFDIPSSSIAMFRAFVDTYYVSLVNGAEVYTTAVPVPNTSKFNNGLVYSIQAFVNAINTALEDSIIALNTAHPGTVPDNSVFVTFDRPTGLFSFNFTSDYFFVNKNIQIWLNDTLYLLFPGFDVFFNGYGNSNFLDYQILTGDYANNAIKYANSSYNGTYFQNTQEGKCASVMSDINTMVFTTNSIPIVGENTAVATSSFNTTGLSSSLKILADFIPGVDTFNTPASAGAFQYNPQIYRLNPLIGNSPMYTVDLQAYYTTVSGRLIPLYIAPGENFSVKLLFLKKGLTS